MDAAERMGLDLPRSWIVGDRASDIVAGKAAGLSGGVLIASRALPRERDGAMPLRSEDFGVDVVGSLAEAVDLLLARGAFTQSPVTP
jgi:D-glycero-D-manno-heptose 1,7-bisphosphate phosphatase